MAELESYLKELLEERNWNYSRLKEFARCTTSKEDLARLAELDNQGIKICVAENPYTSGDTLRKLAYEDVILMTGSRYKCESWPLLIAIAQNPNTPTDALKHLYYLSISKQKIRPVAFEDMIFNPTRNLEKIRIENRKELRHYIEKNPNTSEEIREEISKNREQNDYEDGYDGLVIEAKKTPGKYRRITDPKAFTRALDGSVIRTGKHCITGDLNYARRLDGSIVRKRRE